MVFRYPRSGLVLMLVLLSVCVAVPAAASAERVAVLNIEGNGLIDDSGLMYLTDRVREATLKYLGPRGFEVMSRDNMTVLLEMNAADLAACEKDCAVETGRTLGAQQVVHGRQSKLGSSFDLVLEVHDTASGRLLASQSTSAADLDELKEGLDPLCAALFGVTIEEPEAPEPEMLQPALVEPPTPAPAIGRRLAVLRFSSEHTLRRNLTMHAAIVREAAAALGWEVVPRDEMLAALYDGPPHLATCETGCEVEQGAASGADVVVAGRLTMAAGAYRLRLDAYGVIGGAQLASAATESLSFTELTEETETLANRLLEVVSTP